MTTSLLTAERMVLAIEGRKWTDCQLCGRKRRCYRLLPCFVPGQQVEILTCRTCLGQVTDAVYEPNVATFLSLAVDDALKLMARLTLQMEAERRKALAKGWEDTVVVLLRALDGKQGSAGNTITLVKAVHSLTGLGLMEAKRLVDGALARLARPLELPPDGNGAPATQRLK